MINILLVEDQIMMRDLLFKLIDEQEDMKVVGSIGNASKALEMCRKHSPDLVLMDIRTEKNESGITATSMIKREFSHIKVILMTGMPEITYINSAINAGANSFLYKNVDSATILSTIRSTMSGYETFPRTEPSKLPFNVSFDEAEIKVLRLVCDTKSRKEIAHELCMSESSIKNIITNILNKTGYDSILKFAIFAVSNGYIVPENNFADKKIT